MSEHTLCSRPWDIPIYYSYNNSFSYCSKTPKIKIDTELLQKLGDNFWSNHPDILDRRKSLLQGRRHSDCEACWKLEDNGFKSARNVDDVHYFMRRNIKDLSWETAWSEFQAIPNIEYSNYTNNLEIFLNNTCDAKCTYCNESYSSLWESEKRRFNELPLNFAKSKIKNKEIETSFWNWYKNKASKTVCRVGFMGGEPLIQDELYECFDKLIDIHTSLEPRDDPEPIEIYIVSNLNTPNALLDKFLKYAEKLKKYFKIKLQVSGEALGLRLEYIRFGVEYKQWQNNIHKIFKNQNIEVAFQPTINLLSLPTLDKYLKFFLDLCLEYRFVKLYFNTVSYPLPQSPMLAYKKFTPHIDDAITTLNKIIESDQEFEKQRAKSYTRFLDGLSKIKTFIFAKDLRLEEAKLFYQYFSILDTRRKTNLVNCFPEFKEMYEQGAQYEC